MKTIKVSEAIAEQQAEESLTKLLAECRCAFPVPEPGSPLEVQWMAAMARPEEVPEYVRMCVASMQAAPKAAPAWADQAVIEYRYAGGTHWCPLGPAERMKPDFQGVYRLQGGVFPVEQAAPQGSACIV